MIIASGFKIWPREVEDMLYQHPSVQEAAVIGVPDLDRRETAKALRGAEGRLRIASIGNTWIDVEGRGA